MGLQIANLNPQEKQSLESSLRRWQAEPVFHAAEKVYSLILTAGFEVYFAGGCVRDLLLGRKPNDFDLASSASPEELENIFPKTIPVGKQFGILVVVQDGYEIEVARFRTEGKYLDGRHPDGVLYASAKEDALRRDFTVNALFLSLGPLCVFDEVGGVADIEAQVLRAVGPARSRFAEDHLRILRALRFQSQLGFQLEETLRGAIQEQAELAVQVSPERFFEEWSKLLTGIHAGDVLKCLRADALMPRFFSDLKWSDLVFDSTLRQGEKSGVDWAFVWVWAFLSGSAESEIVNVWRKLRPSKEWLQEMTAAMAWFFHPIGGEVRSGPLLQRIYSRKESLRGLVLWVETQGKANETWYLSLMRLYQHWGSISPQPWVRGADLADLYSGPVLGERLQKIFWLQLERRVNSPEEAIQLARNPNFA